MGAGAGGAAAPHPRLGPERPPGLTPGPAGPRPRVSAPSPPPPRIRRAGGGGPGAGGAEDASPVPRHPAFPRSQGPNVPRPLPVEGGPRAVALRRARPLGLRTRPSPARGAGVGGSAGMQVGGAVRWAPADPQGRWDVIASQPEALRPPPPWLPAPAGLSPRREKRFCRPSTGRAAPSASSSPEKTGLQH